MAWAGPSTDKPVWCAPTGKAGPTAQSLACTTNDPSGNNPELALLQAGASMQPHPANGEGETASDGAPMGAIPMPASYTKFTSQAELGKYLTSQYHIRTPNELASCETCHR
jgi:hypothetical protein